MNCTKSFGIRPVANVRMNAKDEASVRASDFPRLCLCRDTEDRVKITLGH
jgi:hypothetical protein